MWLRNAERGSMTREEQISNGFIEMMKGFWNNPELETPCKQEPCEDVPDKNVGKKAESEDKEIEGE